jgi:hypothetical protein
MEHKMLVDDTSLTRLTQGTDAEKALLAQTILDLRNAIRNHQSKRGHDLCWLNDVTLWQSIDPQAQYPHFSLPVHDEFLAGCERYFQSRIQGTGFENPTIVKTVTDI